MDFELAWPRPPAPPVDAGNAAGLAIALRGGIAAALAAQRGHQMLWLPVALAAGAAFYFVLPVEPHGLLALLAAGLALAMAIQLRCGALAPIFIGFLGAVCPGTAESAVYTAGGRAP